MSTAELPENLLHFLRSSIPSFAAAELLLFLAKRGEQPATPAEIVEAIKPTVISLAAVKAYLAYFKQQRLIEEDLHAGFHFAPATPELRTAVEDLAQAYNERPVTLIRTIYSLAELKIQSFADSFRLKQE